jgi:hypothetical protein
MEDMVRVNSRGLYIFQLELILFQVVRRVKANCWPDVRAWRQRLHLGLSAHITHAKNACVFTFLISS